MQVNVPNDHTDTTRPARRTTPPEPADTTEAALTRLLDADPAIQRAKLQHNIAKVICQMVTGLPKLSAPHCADAMDHDQWDDLQRAYDRMGAWIEQVRDLRGSTPLRLVK